MHTGRFFRPAKGAAMKNMRKLSGALLALLLVLLLGIGAMEAGSSGEGCSILGSVPPSVCRGLSLLW